MHERTATTRTIKPFESATCLFGRKPCTSSVPPPPAIGRTLPPKVVAARSVLHPALDLPPTTCCRPLLHRPADYRQAVHLLRRNRPLPVRFCRRSIGRDRLDARR